MFSELIGITWWSSVRVVEQRTSQIRMGIRNHYQVEIGKARKSPVAAQVISVRHLQVHQEIGSGR